MPGTTTTALPAFSHDKHHKTDAAKRKEGMTEVMVMTTGTKRRAKLQSNRHHQQTNTQLLMGWMQFVSRNQQFKALKGNRQINHKRNKTETN